MKFLFFLLLFLALANVSLHSQQTAGTARLKGDGAISGVVIDSVSKTGLPYATVALIDTKNSQTIAGVITKGNGEFDLRGVPDGEFEVKCSYMGFTPKSISKIVVSKLNKLHNLSKIALVSKSIGKESVIVTAEKDNVTYSLDKKIINVSQNPNAQGGRIVDVLQNIPSVSVDTEGKVTIRGSGNFQVLIDGKPSPMQGNDALKSIPADAVENIELITNPSAKYDPDGTAGIVNIVLKKASLNGINGIINASAGFDDKYNADGQFNYRHDDVNLYAGLEWQDMKFNPSSRFIRETYSLTKDTTFIVDPLVERSMMDKTMAAKAGIEYNIDPKQYVSLSSNVYRTSFQRVFPSKFRVYSLPATDEEYYLNEDDYKIKGYYTTINGYYQKSFEDEGHQISSMANAIIWDGNGLEKMRNVATDKNFNPLNVPETNHNAGAWSRSFMFKYKADYSLPLSDDYRFEAGYNFDYTQDFSDYEYMDFNNNTGHWDMNMLFSNDTKYYHTINAVYGTFGGKLWDFDYQLGLRAEYFNRRLEQSTNDELYKYNKVSVFPTVHVSRQLPANQQLQFSYSRRVQRPDVYALNPFPDYSDDYFVSVGNPQLMPEYTNSYELNYQKSFETVFCSAQTYYRQTDNAMTRVLRMNTDNRIWITSENASESKVFGLELSANVNIIQGLRFNLSGNYYNYTINNGSKSVEEDKSGNVFDGNAMLFYSITPTTLVQLTAYYMGPKITTDGRTKETYAMGLSLRQFLFDRKLTLFLNGRNVLNSMKFRSENRREDFYTHGSFNPEGNVYSLGLSWNINNYESKQRPEDQIERTNAGSSGGY